MIAATLDELIERRAEEAAEEIRQMAAAARAALGLRPVIEIESGQLLRVPQRFACPECGGRLYVEIIGYYTQDRIATPGGYYVYCEAEEKELQRASDGEDDPAWEHCHYQFDWQPVIDRVGRYLVRRVRVRH